MQCHHSGFELAAEAGNNKEHSKYRSGTTIWAGNGASRTGYGPSNRIELRVIGLSAETDKVSQSVCRNHLFEAASVTGLAGADNWSRPIMNPDSYVVRVCAFTKLKPIKKCVAVVCFQRPNSCQVPREL